MPRPTYLNMTPIARDPDGLAESQQLATDGAVVLDGVQADLGTAGVWDISDTSYPASIGGVRLRHSGASEGVTFTVVGTDENGASKTEVITGAAGSPATDTATYWSTVSSVTGSGQHHAFTIGPAHGVVSKTVPLNWRNREGVGADYAVYDLETTAGDVAASIWEYFGPFQTDGFATDGWTQKVVAAATEGITVGTTHARAVKVALATHGASFQMGILQN